MLYYLGKGTELKKKECKEYKTIEGALKAAAKDESLVVWDENGEIIGSLTDDVPEGALQTADNGKKTTQENAEDGENASNEDEATNTPSEQEKGENEANTESEEEKEEHPEDEVIIPQGKMKVTVICDGSLNIRRSAAWGNENICGRAIRGQSYYVKEIHVVDGKKMVRTVGDLYLSGESEHVQFEQL